MEPTVSNALLFYQELTGLYKRIPASAFESFVDFMSTLTYAHRIEVYKSLPRHFEMRVARRLFKKYYPERAKLLGMED